VCSDVALEAFEGFVADLEALQIYDADKCIATFPGLALFEEHEARGQLRVEGAVVTNDQCHRLYRLWGGVNPWGSVGASETGVCFVIAGDFTRFSVPMHSAA
jgi:hypothetical protein